MVISFMRKRSFLCIGVILSMIVMAIAFIVNPWGRQEKHQSYTEDLQEEALLEDFVLSVGESGKTELYNPDFKKHSDQTVEVFDAEVSLDSVVRGEEALAIVTAYNQDTKLRPVAKLKDKNLEFAIAKYTIIPEVDKFYAYYHPRIESKIFSLDLSSEIVFDDKSYKASTTRFIETDRDYFIGNTPCNGRFIFVIPVGCTDYVISLGESPALLFRE